MQKPTSLCLGALSAPEDNNINLYLAGHKLIFQAVGLSGIRKTLDREAKIKQIQPKKEMLYLWFIGVNPLYQHRGTGSKLLADIIMHAVRNDLPVYLETSNLQNLSWYGHFGFQVYGELALSYQLYFLSNRVSK